MSRMASRARRVRASRLTWRNAPPAASTVDTTAAVEEPGTRCRPVRVGATPVVRRSRLTGWKDGQRSEDIGDHQTRPDDGRLPDRARLDGGGAGPGRRRSGARRPSGRSRTSRSRADRSTGGSIRALALIKAEAAAVNAGAGRAGRRRAASPTPSATAAEEVAEGTLGRPVPHRRVPDRLGHLVEHERQRGDRPPRRASARVEPAGAPQRPRQRRAVVQRRVPVGHPPGRRRGDRRPTWCRRSSHLADGAAGQGRREFADGREVGPHPPDGRHARSPSARSSAATPPRSPQAIERLRRCAAPRSASCPSAAPRWAPASTRPGLRRRRHQAPGRAHRPAAHRGAATTSPPRAPATRWSRCRASCGPSAVALIKIANDIRWMAIGPAHRPGRDPPARPAARARRSCRAR